MIAAEIIALNCMNVAVADDDDAAILLHFIQWSAVLSVQSASRWGGIRSCVQAPCWMPCFTMAAQRNCVGGGVAVAG